MLNFFIIVFSLLAGALLRRSGRLPERTPHYLNRYVINVALPAAILANIPGLAILPAALLPGLMPWIVFALGAGLFLGIGRAMNLDRRTEGALMLTGSLGNTSFVGFPVLTVLFGEDALKTGIIIDQAGSFLVVATLGIAVATAYSHKVTGWQEVVRRILTFPPFIVLVIALALRTVEFPPTAHDFFRTVALTLGPAALISVGFQLRLKRDVLREKSRALILGLSYKLVISPIIIALIYLHALPVTHDVAAITIVEAAMPPMITAAIIADEYGLDDGLTNLMVGIGIPLSLVTIPLWYLLLR